MPKYNKFTTSWFPCKPYVDKLGETHTEKAHIDITTTELVKNFVCSQCGLEAIEHNMYIDDGDMVYAVCMEGDNPTAPRYKSYKMPKNDGTDDPNETWKIIDPPDHS